MDLNKEIIQKVQDLYEDIDKFNNYVSIVSGRDDKKIRGTFEKLYSMINWFEMFSEALQEFDLKKYEKSEINKQTIDFVNYISCCNGIVDVYEGLEVVAQINLNINEKYSISGCFSKTRKVNEEHDNSYQMAVSDIKYFKHIRAIFGQHSANIEYKIDGKAVRAFASWPFRDGWFCGGDCDGTNINKDMYVNICDNIGINEGFGVKFFVIFDEIEDFMVGVREGIIHWIDTIERNKEDTLANKKLIFEKWEEMTSLEKVDAINDMCEREYYYKSIEPESSHYLSWVCDGIKEMLNFEKIDKYEDESIKYVREIEDIIEELKEKVGNFSFEEIESYRIFKGKLSDVIGDGYYAEKCSSYLRLGETKNKDSYDRVVDGLMLKLGVSQRNNFHYLRYLLYCRGEKVFDKDPFLKD